MSNFKPQITIVTAESVREASYSYGKKPHYKVIRYETYRELKKHIRQHLEDAIEWPVSVVRSKRGEWGEWFEQWQLINGVPTIVKEGWN
jgi:hypothetical protein